MCSTLPGSLRHRFVISLSFHFSAYPHGRKSIYALLMGIGSYLFLSVSMWSCVYVKIDGYLDSDFPYIERVSAEVRYVKNHTFKDMNSSTHPEKCSSFNRHSCIHLRSVYSLFNNLPNMEVEVQLVTLPV